MPGRTRRCPQPDRRWPVAIWPRVCAALVADVPAVAGVDGAPMMVVIVGGVREVLRELGMARVWPAWAEVNGRGERTAAPM